MARRRTTARLATVAAAALAASTLTVATSSQATAATAACADVHVTYAAGTNFSGGGSLGPDPVYDALVSAVNARVTGKTVSYHRLDYPASLAPWSASTGNWNLVQHLTAQAQACPNQKFVLAGYSQGAAVINNSIGISSLGVPIGGGPIVAEIPTSVEPRVKAIVLYGNPVRGYPLHTPVTGTYQARTHDDCATGDVVCTGIWEGNMDAHGSYSQPEHSGPAGDFIAARV